MNYAKFRPYIVQVNKILTTIILFLAVYIIVTPLYPVLSNWWQNQTNPNSGYVYKDRLAEELIAVGVLNEANLLPLPKENRLVIPKIFVDTEIYTGGVEALNKGTWLRPNGSTPDQGSNTVLAAHRYMYTSGPNSFYHLDKLAIGDKFTIFWQQKEYNYEVESIRIVAPTTIEVEAPTNQPYVTLYTCTPLWTSENRLVIRAKLI